MAYAPPPVPAVVPRHDAAEVARDLEAIMATVPQDCVWEARPFMTMVGRAAVRAWYERQIRNFYPRLGDKRSIRRWQADETTHISESEFSWLGDDGVKAVGRALAIMTLDGEFMSGERVYFTGDAFAACYRALYQHDEAFFATPGVTRLAAYPLP